MNKKNIVDEAIRELNQQKFNNELIAEQNYKKARNISADFASLDIQLREKKIQYAQTEQNSQQNIQLSTEISQLEQKRIAKLNEIGFSEKDILPRIICPKCNDNGFINNKMCSCLRTLIHQKLLKNSGLENFIEHSFEDCDEQILKDNETLSKIYTLSKNYIEKFPNTKTPNLVFMGEVGVGKTFLLQSIANALLKKEFYVVYVTAFNLSNTMLKAMATTPFESDLLLSPILECDLLIIDDLGSEPFVRNLSTSNLFTVLNEREIHSKSTLISTNLSLTEIEERYGNRLFSRIANKRTTKIIKFTGKDLRINN